MAHNAIGADDYTTFIGLFFTTMFVVVIIINLHYSLGRHLILVTEFPGFNKGILASEILNTPAVLTTKISILLLYKYLFPYAPLRYNPLHHRRIRRCLQPNGGHR